VNAITAPTVSGTPTAGETLTCSTGTWSGSPTGFTYQWDRAGVPIGGATSNTYLVQPGDEGQTLTCVVTASNGASAGTLATSTGVPVTTPVTPPASSVVSTVTNNPVVPAPAPTPLPLQCSGKAIVLVSVRQVGASVFLSDIALPKYAGQKVTITLSGVSKKLAKGKGRTAIVATNGTFEAKLVAPSGAGAGLTRYTATVAGNASLVLKLSRALQITADSSVAGGVRVSFLVTGALGSGKHIVTITRQVSCSETVTYKKVKLPSSGRLEIVLPAPKGAGEVSYYRAQTHIAHGNTFSLFSQSRTMTETARSRMARGIRLRATRQQPQRDPAHLQCPRIRGCAPNSFSGRKETKTKRSKRRLRLCGGRWSGSRITM
jgi:hypothetical protein